MKSLVDLLRKAGLPSSAPDNVSISGLSYDSRTAKSGDLFFAIKGQHADGHAYLNEVAKKGIAAAVAERAVTAPFPVIVVPDIHAVMSKISSFFYDDPSQKCSVIGVTGTNGKTTTTFLIENILRALGQACGVMGTINYRVGNDVHPAANTTPFSADVQKFIWEATQKKIGTVVMEVSSHALALHRVDDVRFSVGVFTNLTQDHLDFHRTMENYFEAKASLFRRPEPPRAVVNADDDYGRRLLAEFPRALSFGFSEKASLRATEVTCDLRGIRFTLRGPSGRSYDVSTNLLGRHNISNCLAAAGAMMALGFSEEDVVKGLNQNHTVPGRLERVDAGQKFVVAVDYAHTHDALSQVLTTLRQTRPNRLLCLFGAGGDRDRTKRPKMGAVAADIADFVYLTSDNPRSEEPLSIIKEIEAGIKERGKNNYTIIESRKEAIHKAVSDAKEGDILLIAGKGHETVQITGDQKIHFSDVEVAREALRS